MKVNRDYFTLLEKLRTKFVNQKERKLKMEKLIHQNTDLITKFEQKKHHKTKQWLKLV